MMKTNRHRTALACVAWGHPRWRLLLLEMLSTCTCYSRLHWRWFGYVSPCYWTTWSSLVLARFRFLMDHMSGPLLFHMSVFYWHTYHVAFGSHVISSLYHVSYFYWSTWSFLIRPRVTVLSVHVLFFLFGHIA